jgi:hypothetical protein
MLLLRLQYWKLQKLQLMSKSYEYHSAAGSLPVEVSSEGVGNNTQATVKALGPSDFEEENRSSERPKLNLKPRSLSVEQLEASNEKDRKSLFGGARPGEMVLKERGVDDVVISSVDPAAVVNSAKGNTTNSKDTDPFDDKEVELNVDSSGSGNNIRQNDSGLLEELLCLDIAEESYMIPPGKCVLEFPRAVHESVFPELRVFAH